MPQWQLKDQFLGDQLLLKSGSCHPGGEDCILGKGEGEAKISLISTCKRCVNIIDL